MKAVCYYGTEDVRVETVPDPAILNPRDAIVRVTSVTSSWVKWSKSAQTTID